MFNLLIMCEMEKKGFYHSCMSLQDEVLFRCEEDFGAMANCIALALYKTDTSLLADSLMSNHLHLVVESGNLPLFVKNLKMRYSCYFENKYGRKSVLKDASCFDLELEGLCHCLAGISYVLRNGLHHGQCETAFGYEYSTVNYLFHSELGKVFHHDVLSSRNDMMKYLPRHSEFPDHYVMDKGGVFLRESFTQIRQVEHLYGSARTFLFYMTRRSGDDKWKDEQRKENYNISPVTLDVIEKGINDMTVNQMMMNECSRFSKNRFSDMDVCKIIDGEYVPKFGKSSVYQLSDMERMRVRKELCHQRFVPERQVGRCLGMSGG